jgi:hypothetical protein
MVRKDMAKTVADQMARTLAAVRAGGRGPCSLHLINRLFDGPR